MSTKYLRNPLGRIFVSLLLAFGLTMAMSSLVTSARAGVVVDQSHFVLGGLKVSLDHDGQTAQSFTVGQSGTLDHIDVFLFMPRPFATFPLQLSLQGLSGGIPGGITVASDTASGSEIFAGRMGTSLNTRVTFDLSGADIDVIAGDMFAFVLEGQGTAGSGTWLVEAWHDIWANPYLGGTAFDVGDGSVQPYDLSFQTFVDPIPEPASLAILALGIGGIASLRRRRIRRNHCSVQPVGKRLHRPA